MLMKEHLRDTFKFNDMANKKMIKKIAELPDKNPCIKYMSHLINSQYNWMARIREYPEYLQQNWWEPVYTLDNLQEEWTKSLTAILELLESKTEEELFNELRFIGYDGGTWSSTLKDLFLQLNYHSIHHRAQMQTIIRSQGLQPDFLDYMITVVKKINQE